ncbi:PTS ascorbate transporter subunit IIC [Streptomyces sp. AJS327]|uniref:PTS ascorbate transporter subunit IIC n=1 Tax=Streptomyces sp. AJS327 TaxID=2545265 RepID=UPI0015DD85E7|nr:PTS ascorbate transporter subunit IIC [Streptomyces sp. AJS327]MBA0051289.1 PTS ascorbate transporter subunit IIC [Streptomyces sp. AJS327]
MDVLNFLLEIVQVPAIIIGCIALIGLLAQRKPLGDTVSGTIKTTLSLLVIAGGITVLIEALTPIQTMFEKALPTGRITTFATFDEAVVSAVQTADVGRIGMLIGLTLLFGYAFHLLLARVTRARYVYLTGHMIWVHAGAFAILFHSLDLGDVVTVAAASVVDGAYMTFAPALAQPVMRKITGRDDVAFGHGQTLLNVAAAGLGKLVGDPKKSTEDIKVPAKLNFFRDVAVSTTLVMFVIAFAAAAGAISQIGLSTFTKDISDGQNWLVFTLLSALGFAAGMLIMLYGVRMLIAEIVPAFEGIARRIIPSAKPALDVPVIFSFAPNALVIGLISGVIGQVVGMGFLAAIGWPVPIPSMIVAFFACGAAAIFANATGGRRGAWAGGFLWGFLGWILISAAYKFQVFGDLSAQGAKGLGFTVPDVIVPGLVIHSVDSLLGPWMAVALAGVVVVTLVAFTWQPKLPTSTEDAPDKAEEGSAQS